MPSSYRKQHNAEQVIVASRPACHPTCYDFGSTAKSIHRHAFTSYTFTSLWFMLPVPAMTKDRIAELLAPFRSEYQLSDPQLSATARYLDLLVKWNAHINLTAVRDPEEIIRRHFGESLFAAMHLFPDQSASATAIDIGSGAGFPGVPLKIWAQGLEVSLIESNQKKATFLRELARAINLTGLNVVSDRAENLSIKADLITLRAVENFEQALQTAGRLVSQVGRIGLLIGESQLELARSGLAALDWNQPLPIPQSQSRILLVGQFQR